MTRRTTSRLTSAAAVAVLLSALGACSSEDDGTAEDPASSPSSASSAPSPTASSTPSEPESSAPSSRPAGPGLAIEVSGSDVGPNAEQVELEVGETLALRIVSDRAGELHVHSRPEQYVEFEAGRSAHELVVESPGVVEVEEHESGVVVAVLRVGG